MKHATACMLLLGLVCGYASAQWFDGFESYPCDHPLNDPNGWHGWNNNPAVIAYVRCAPAPIYKGLKSVEIGRPGVDTDCVHEYTGYNKGTWSYRAWQYIPTALNGKTYFILMHTYEDNGAQGWAVQVWFDKSTGMVHVDNTNCPPQPPDVPIVFDKWVEIRVDIDFDNDWYDFWYNGQKIAKKKGWSIGVFCGDTGPRDLAAVDLYANSSWPAYYDDIEILKTSGACCDETTGNCQDNMAPEDCFLLTQRYVPFKKCNELQPACGQGVGACCFHDPDCARPCVENTYAQCSGLGGEWLGFQTTCAADCCCIVCRDGIEGDPEGEPLCGPEYKDTYNGGCLDNPPTPKALEMFKVGQTNRTFCGKSGTFVKAGLKARDADWYHLNVPGVPTQLVAEWSVEFPAVIGMYDNNGQLSCCSRFLKGAKSTAICKSDSFFTCLVKGDWYVVVRPANFEGVACTAGYKITFTRDDFGGQGCTPATGACCLPDKTCVVTDEVDCEIAKKGYYLGDDTICQGSYCPECPVNTLDSQFPDVADGAGWIAGTSDKIDTTTYIRYEDVYVVGLGTVTDLHWWGLDLGRDPNGWIECDDPAPNFEIAFYHSKFGIKGAEPDLTQQIGQTYQVQANVVNIKQVGGRQLKKFDVVFNPPVNKVASRVWVQVLGKDDDPLNCYFLWFSSGENGKGYSWLSTNGAGDPDVFDLSVCVTGQKTKEMGDLNCDDVVNLFDIDPYVLALTNPAGYNAAFPNCDRYLADMNLDGVVNNFDIDPFVICLTQKICPKRPRCW